MARQERTDRGRFPEPLAGSSGLGQGLSLGGFRDHLFCNEESGTYIHGGSISDRKRAVHRYWAAERIHSPTKIRVSRDPNLEHFSAAYNRIPKAPKAPLN